MYPNSATRKLYGQAGRALERQNKRFTTIQQRLNKESRDRELSLKESLESNFEQEQAKMKRLIKRIVIGFAIVVVILIMLVIIL